MSNLYIVYWGEPSIYDYPCATGCYEPRPGRLALGTIVLRLEHESKFDEWKILLSNGRVAYLTHPSFLKEI